MSMSTTRQPAGSVGPRWEDDTMTITTARAADDVEDGGVERKARIRAGMVAAFADGVRSCLSNTQDGWSVAKVADRVWKVADASGADRGARYTTRCAAIEELQGGRLQRQWRDRVDWYLGDSSDPRTRALADDERAAVEQVVAELGTIEWSDPHGGRCRIETNLGGQLRVHEFGDDGYDLWGYDHNGHYSGPHDHVPFRRSPFHTADDVDAEPAQLAPGAGVTHPDRDDTGTVIDSGDPAWTPNELTDTAPAADMVKVRWSDSVDPTQLYWEYSAELRVVAGAVH